MVRTQWTSQGPGGNFTGGGSLLGGGEGIQLSINVTTSADNSALYETKDALDQVGTSYENLATGTTQIINADKEKTKVVKEQSTAHKEGKSANDLQAESLRESIAPIRSVSWDLMLMGRSLSILNNIWGHHNVIVQQVTGVIYAVGAVLRIGVTAVDIWATALKLSSAATTVQTANNWGLSASYFHVAGTYYTVANAKVASDAAMGASNISLAGTFTTLAAAARTAYAAIGPIGWAMIAIGAVIGIGYAIKGSMQGGGTVSETGAYMLHKGETVVPAETYVPHKGETVVSSGPSTNIINITMNSGPISSSVDVDNMLDNMAIRMAQESRRRIGR
jgi:hypothetical protein